MPDEYELIRARKKYMAIRRAERRLQNRLDDIDWEYDILLPEVKELEKNVLEGKTPRFEITDGSK